MTVRNACVARGLLAAVGAPTVYTVPAGNVLLLKSIALVNSNASSSNVQVLVRAVDGSAQVPGEQVTLAGGASAYWSGWIALNGGDTIIINTSQPTLGYWISGAVLPYATP